MIKQERVSPVPINHPHFLSKLEKQVLIAHKLGNIHESQKIIDKLVIIFGLSGSLIKFKREMISK